MQSRSITDMQALSVPADRAFRTLITPSEIQIWWNANSVVIIPQKDGVWCASWGKDGDLPDFVMSARLSEFESGRQMTMTDFSYLARQGPMPQTENVRTEFAVTSDPGNPDGSILTVIQSGFPPVGDPATDEFYNGCITGWRTTLQAIADFFYVD